MFIRSRTGPDRDDFRKPAAALYEEFVRSTAGVRLDGMKIVIDCANGAASVLAKNVFSGLGADVTVICSDPDRININDGCGSTHPEKLCEQVRQEKADLGLAFDRGRGSSHRGR